MNSKLLNISLFFFALTPDFIESEARAAPPPITDYDVEQYSLKIALDLDQKESSGTVDVTFRAVQSNLNEIKLDLVDGVEVLEVLQEEQDITFSHENDVLSITLSSPISSGESATVKVNFSGAPEMVMPPPEFKPGFLFEENHVILIGSPGGWPCRIKNYDRALVEVEITVADGLWGIGPGTLLEKVDNPDDTTTFRWGSDAHISCGYIQVVAGDYEEFTSTITLSDENTIMVRSFVYPDDSDKGESLTELNGRMLPAFIELFGPYPYMDDGLTMFETPIGPAGLQFHAGYALGSRLIASGELEFTMSHEVSHIWWGGGVAIGDETAYQANCWLEEGFATYSSALWAEIDKDIEARREVMKENREIYMADSEHRSSPISAGSPNCYEKSAWVIHMLRRVLGDDVFFEVLRTFIAQYVGKAATTEDFIEIVSQVTHEDYAWFFDQWIYRAGEPVIEYTVKIDPTDTGAFTTLELNQIQEGEVYRFPLDVLLASDSKEERKEILVDSKKQQFDLSTEFVPVRVELDPDEWLLGSITEKTPAQPEEDLKDEGCACHFYNPLIDSADYFCGFLFLLLFGFILRQRNIKEKSMESN